MFTSEEQKTIAAGKAILASKLNTNSAFTSPDAVKDFCLLALASREHEVFMVLFLNSQHQLIEAVELFRGTINAASVYPREVAKEALARNAAAVILAHNHPSGLAEPSQADIRITDRLVSALDLIDIRVLDHIVVGAGGTVSLAERGEI